MPTITIRVPGYTPEVFTLTEEQQKVTLKLWLDAGATIVKPAWIPTYQPQQYVTNPVYGPMPLNIYDYATQETATEIMDRFGGSHLAQVPYIQNSPDTSTAKQWWVVFPDGIAVNAGPTARPYKDRPEDLYPGEAQKQAQAMIDLARREGTHLPTQVAAT